MGFDFPIFRVHLGRFSFNNRDNILFKMNQIAFCYVSSSSSSGCPVTFDRRRDPSAGASIGRTGSLERRFPALAVRV
jgi:hypothetical protein